MTIFQKINLIPDLINEKKLTETQAVNYICTQLLKNPKLFIRENLEEDLISDLIEILLQKKDAIFSSYKKEISPFYSFLKNYKKIESKNYLKFIFPNIFFQISFNKKENVSIVHYR